MGFVAFLLVGLIAGWIAGMVMKGRGYGFFGNIILGVIGAFVGGFLGNLFLGWEVTGFNLGSIVLATLGAVVVIMAMRALPGAQPFE